MVELGDDRQVLSALYLLDSTSPNTGTMPSGALVEPFGNPKTGDIAGATTARDATDVAGSANPDTESQVTATANTLTQIWGHRRFVSRPLAARTFAAADGNWTISFAWYESNTNHAAATGCPIECAVYPWRPSTGAQVGTAMVKLNGTATGFVPSTAEQATTIIDQWSATQAILDGDILVFDVVTRFAQSMSTAYTENFAYNGTTEASTTTCASFVSPPSALTLYTPTTATPRRVLQAGNVSVQRASQW